MKSETFRALPSLLAPSLALLLFAACSKSGANNSNTGSTTTSTTTTNKATSPANTGTETTTNKVTTGTAPSSSSELHTPPEGSAERTAILDAIRDQQKRKTSLTIAKFTVESLKVHNGWAYIVTDTESADGEPYGMLEALLQDQGGQWKMVEEVDSDRASVKARYKDAPEDIFPPDEK